MRSEYEPPSAGWREVHEELVPKQNKEENNEELTSLSEGQRFEARARMDLPEDLAEKVTQFRNFLEKYHTHLVGADYEDLDSKKAAKREYCEALNAAADQGFVGIFTERFSSLEPVYISVNTEDQEIAWKNEEFFYETEKDHRQIEPLKELSRLGIDEDKIGKSFYLSTKMPEWIREGFDREPTFGEVSPYDPGIIGPTELDIYSDNR